jgi:hypothetical protein
MKASYFFTIVVFAALSTSVGLAEDRGHDAGADAGTHASGTATQGQVKPAAEGPQSSVSSSAAPNQIKEGAARDGAGVAPADQNGKRVVDTSGPRAKTPLKSDAPVDAAPVGALGQPHLLAPSHGTKENGESSPIGTRIVVHQGRQAPNSNGVKELRDLKERLFKNSKTAILPAIDPTHLSVHNHQQTSPLGTDGAPARNAVGAIIEHRAVGPRSNPPSPSDATRQLSSGVPTTGTPALGERARGTATDDPAKPLNGTVPAISPSPTQLVNHPSKTPALAIVTTNSPAVNGTGMIRPGSGGGAVGGQAKIVGGAINGSAFRLKHP